MEVSMTSRKFSIYDVVVGAILFLIVFLLIFIAKRWAGPLLHQSNISLNPINLFEYTFFSMSRGFIAYGLSLIFTLVVGYMAAKNKYLEKIILPLLDIFQSIPVLGFLPGLLLALITLFPHSEIGLELVSIIMIFTGQVWNMVFSFYQSLKSTPTDLIEAAKIYNLSKWGIFFNVELPYAMPGLVWNSMMSMAGGWFFLTVCESFTLGDKVYSIPGIGSYMALAMNKGYVAGQVYGILAMILMIVLIDIVFWRPIIAWSSKFSLKEESSETYNGSFLLNVLINSHIIRFFREILFKNPIIFKSKSYVREKKYTKEKSTINNFVFYSFLSIITVFAAMEFYNIIKDVTSHEILKILFYDGITASRVYGSILLSVLWTLPVGIFIGKSPKLSKKLQSIIQILASFPAPLIYPWFVLMFPQLNYSSVILMMLGTQWYILFNVMAGASTVPHNLEEVSNIFNIRGLKKMMNLYIPAVAPYLVTGIITAAGGAWNASIVAEYMNVKGKIIQANGIGALINHFTNMGELHLLAISVIIMSLSVVFVNRLIWRPLQRFASERFSI